MRIWILTGILIIVIGVLSYLLIPGTYDEEGNKTYDTDVVLQYIEFEEIEKKIIEALLIAEYGDHKLITVQQFSETDNHDDSYESFKVELIRSCHNDDEYEMTIEFLSKNKLPTDFSNINFDDIQVTFIPKEAYDKLFSFEEKNRTGLRGWDGFYKQYPGSGGMIEISRVGFNTAKTKAMVYHGCQSGWLAGRGSYSGFEKKDGKWVPTFCHIWRMWESKKEPSNNRMQLILARRTPARTADP